MAKKDNNYDDNEACCWWELKLTLNEVCKDTIM